MNLHNSDRKCDSKGFYEELNNIYCNQKDLNMPDFHLPLKNILPSVDSQKNEQKSK